MFAPIYSTSTRNWRAYVRIRTDRESGNAHSMVRYEEYWMRSLFARGLVAALTLGTLAVSQVAKAQTESNADTPIFLFGNEGLGVGSLPLGGIVGGSNSGYTHPTLAQGFTVGEIPYVVTTVDLGLVLPTDALNAMATSDFALDIALFSSVEDTNGKQVPGERVLTFNPVPTNTTDGAFIPNRKGLYTFGYLNADRSNAVTLEAETSYWVIVSYAPQDSSAQSFYWQFAVPSGTDLPERETPVEKNTSGVTYLGTIGQHAFGGDWVDHGNSSGFPDSGLRFGINGYEPEIVNPGGGGGEQTPPTLPCYAYSKGYFKNNYPSGWPASVIADGGALIGNQLYTVAQLRTMLSANTTRGNQIGQLASQLVAVHLSRELAKQAAGANYLWWDGWAPDSADAQTAYQQAAELINASLGFDRRGCITGCVYNVGTVISALDGYITDNHCTEPRNDDDHGSCRGRDYGSRHDRDRDRCNKKFKYERRDTRKRHDCR